jgi:hypothetical protein
MLQRRTAKLAQLDQCANGDAQVKMTEVNVLLSRGLTLSQGCMNKSRQRAVQWGPTGQWRFGCLEKRRRWSFLVQDECGMVSQTKLLAMVCNLSLYVLWLDAVAGPDVCIM